MTTSQILRYILAAEFALGGQARVTSSITPSVHRFVLSKANGFFDRMPFIPGRTAASKMQTLGMVMCLASILFAVPQQSLGRATRIGNAALGGLLSTMLLTGEASIHGDVWLPAINIIFAGYLIYNEL